MCDGPLVHNEEGLEQPERIEEEEELDGFDLPRLPPRAYQSISPARNATRSEAFGLLCEQKGQASLEIVDSWDDQYRLVGEIGMTLLAKLKAVRKYKARLRIRGDLESLVKSAFPPAPTAARETRKLSTSTLVNGNGYMCSSADTSQAFAQADELAVGDRAIGIPPDSIVIADLAWEVAILCDSRSMGDRRNDSPTMISTWQMVWRRF